MIGQRLHRARKAAGLSLRELGTQIGLTHAAVKRYEDGQATPSSQSLIKLAKALNVRTEYFFRPETMTLDQIEYRKRSTLPKKQLAAIQHEMIDQVERRIQLENLFPTPPIKSFKLAEGIPESITHFDQVEEIAESVRKVWDLGCDPIPDLIDVLERQGIRVFMIDANADPKFDGLVAFINQMPMIVVGKHWPGDRQRFTLAHELGHLMLAHCLFIDLDKERACNRFAGAFLLPRSSVIQAIGSHRTYIEARELSLLKEEFGLSMAGILYRAKDLGIITPACHAEETRFFRGKGWHILEPGIATASEKAHIFEQLVFHALAEEYIGESKAANLMNMPLTAFQSLRALEDRDAACQ